MLRGSCGEGHLTKTVPFWDPSVLELRTNLARRPNRPSRRRRSPRNSDGPGTGVVLGQRPGRHRFRFASGASVEGRLEHTARHGDGRLMHVELSDARLVLPGKPASSPRGSKAHCHRRGLPREPWRGRPQEGVESGSRGRPTIGGLAETKELRRVSDGRVLEHKGERTVDLEPYVRQFVVIGMPERY